MPLPSSFAAMPSGSLVGGRYRLVAPLGRGGMGTVYEAVDTVTDRVRAIKVVDARVDDDGRARFAAEGMLAGRVESPHVVDVFDRGHDEALDVFFLVMERLRGEDLGSALSGRFSVDRALGILGEVAAGLDALHEEGVVHRDLKPENVFLAREGETTRAVIVDLGLAKSFVSSGARTTRAIGTPLFMSPEQLRGDAWIDARADVYAFGHLAYTLLVGQPYFAPEHSRSGSLYALLLRVVEGPPEPASVRARRADVSLPASFDLWFAKATAADASARYESAGAAFRTLAEALRPSSDLVPPRSVGRARRAYTGGALAALVAASLIGLHAGTRAEARAESAPSALPSSAPPSPEPSVHAEPPISSVDARPPAPSSKPTARAMPATATVQARPVARPATSATRPVHDPLDSM